MGSMWESKSVTAAISHWGLGWFRAVYFVGNSEGTLCRYCRYLQHIIMHIINPRLDDASFFRGLSPGGVRFAKGVLVPRAEALTRRRGRHGHQCVDSSTFDF